MKPSRILIVECMQEISSFNPLPSDYENFHIERGEEMLAQRGRNTALGGALSVLRSAAAASRSSRCGARAARPACLSAAGWRSLSGEIIDAVAAGAKIGQSTASIFRCTARWAPRASSTRKASC